MINERGWPGRRMDRVTRPSPHKPMALRFSDPRGVDVLVTSLNRSFPRGARLRAIGEWS